MGVGTVYRRFPDKGSLVEELFEQRTQSLVMLAEQAPDAPDSWIGLVTMLERAATPLARDPGIRKIPPFATHGHDRVRLARSRIQQMATKVVKRVQRDGKLRADLQPADILFIGFMPASAAGNVGAVWIGIWRRYLALIIDCLRPGRGSVSALPAVALTAEEMVSPLRWAAAPRPYS